MTKRTLFATLVTLVAWNASPADAQGVTGTWQITTETQRGSQMQTLVLAQDGSTLTGTISFQFGGGRGGGGGGGPQTFDIEGGMVEGDSFSFDMTLEFNGNAITLTYSGTVDGDTMSGTRSGGRGGGAPFTGTRAG